MTNMPMRFLKCLNLRQSGRIDMDYIEFVTLMATVLAGFAFLYKESKFQFKELKEDMKSLEKEVKDNIRVQSARSDQLYQMFIDLLNARR